MKISYRLLITAVISLPVSTTTVAGFALILSGGGSNLYDRIVNDGAVIDFLNIGISSVRTGIFNVADMAIMAGAVLIVVATGNTQPGRKIYFQFSIGTIAPA